MICYLCVESATACSVEHSDTMCGDAALYAATLRVSGTESIHPPAYVV